MRRTDDHQSGNEAKEPVEQKLDPRLRSSLVGASQHNCVRSEQDGNAYRSAETNRIARVPFGAHDDDTYHR